jgi:fluoroquinolone resistance protein
MTLPIKSKTHYSDEAFDDLNVDRGEFVDNEFYECTFSRCRLTESVFRRCKLINCVFRQCDLSLIQVPASTFSSVRFEESKLVGVNWMKADWPKTILGSPIAFHACAISHSTFMGLILRGIPIQECVAAEVDFREADLTKADFAGTDLAGCLFDRTNLSEADLSRARNYRIDPGQNVLRGARFSLPEAMSLLYSMDIVLVQDA